MTPNELPPTFQRSSLEGKVAVVTGSTQGLGEATLRLFRDRGCKGLVITGRNEERGKRLANELSTESCKAIFVRADLGNLEEVRNIMKVTDETFGTLDILVNSGACTDRGSIWDTTPEDYDRLMNVNARAPFFLMQDAARIMEREKVAGSIINISSTASYGSMPMLAAYGMSKGALNVATKNIAYSLMWSKIRVNALAIGWMDTPGEDAIQRKLHCAAGDSNWKETGEVNQPFGRLLKTDEVARCIAFCASDESGMMTGCLIDFDQSVWGAGNAPVPPRKDQWARANGMTFSFEEPQPKYKYDSSQNRSPVVTKKSPRNSPGVRRRKKTGQSPKQIPKSSSELSTAESRDRSDPQKDVPEPPFLPSPKTTPVKVKSTLRDKVPDLSPTKSEGDRLVSPIPPPLNDSPPTWSASPKPASPKKAKPVEEPHADEDRPDPTQFRRMRQMQQEENRYRPDDYLPGTDPFAGSQQRKERAKKKYGTSSSTGETSTKYQAKSDEDDKTSNNPVRGTKVDEWLGGATTQRRSYTVKTVRKVQN